MRRRRRRGQGGSACGSEGRGGIGGTAALGGGEAVVGTGERTRGGRGARACGGPFGGAGAGTARGFLAAVARARAGLGEGGRGGRGLASCSPSSPNSDEEETSTYSCFLLFAGGAAVTGFNTCRVFRVGLAWSHSKGGAVWVRRRRREQQRQMATSERAEERLTWSPPGIDLPRWDKAAERSPDRTERAILWLSGERRAIRVELTLNRTRRRA